MERAAVIFRGYVIECVRMDDPQMHLDPEDLGGRADEVLDPWGKEVVLQLRTASEHQNKDPEWERLIDTVDLDTVQDLFFAVARKVFSGVDVNWGKVAAFLNFAYRLIYKALTQNRREVIPKITACVLQVIREEASALFKQQGGWVHVVLNSVIGWNNVIIFTAGILIAMLLYWKMAK
ncbi:hypothetical protein SKAU_G00403320 [Synaphobranchus kaupii]|uniref:Bcl-2 Bcl-2 homology region 1-3 domain-containing protein n=1 Tax=Synaphobranchus kaupii TaxID=118154 RepID=A0A9Q1IAK6_SYNKA|nr:hypothetical protein SKAU_G00403320 [Synaphobranchus kaupii]